QFGFIGEGRSVYSGVVKLPPASIAEWTSGRLHVRKYWSPPAVGAVGTVSFEEAVEETERLLLRAVELRLQADVPVAALLSGGVDSALVCWAIAKLGADITTFTVGTPGHAADESADSIAVARALGIPHQLLPLSDADDPDIRELAEAYAE